MINSDYKIEKKKNDLWLVGWATYAHWEGPDVLSGIIGNETATT